MRVFYEEGLANCFGPCRRCDEGNDVVLSIRSGGNVGQLLSSGIFMLPCADFVLTRGRQHRVDRYLGEIDANTAESVNLCMRGHSKRENREILSAARQQAWPGQGTTQWENLT
ncbi:hypothetical protein Pan14r_04760 [Crateriforma conspicua]|uniref:Uncharacterized protein n=1 Tax=Crateriforma conspicua TaxID=2527996 RepID=A0A5C5Y0U1_9PLAN|nr:hypothetical protein Pan14r_04760 [Crateriforma conspicua]